MLEHVTPLVLTFNEAPNIGRVLERLAWATKVIVLDSYSDDETEAIARGYPNVAFYQRQFDSHASQWNYGLHETGIQTEWALALDADFVLTDAFVQELRTLQPGEAIAGYRARFTYCVDGVPLRGTVYTPVTVLYRCNGAQYIQQGHTQRIQVSGAVATLRSRIRHDDRKSLERWFSSQVKYMRLEAAVLLGTPFEKLDLQDKARRLLFVAPLAMFAYCLIVKFALFDGRRGLLYACQRAVAETILTVILLQEMVSQRRLKSSE